MRTARITRHTSETQITMSLEILTPNMSGSFTGTSNVPFMDHMLCALCVHGHFNIRLEMTGDLEVDCHHTIEDIGIVLGQLFKEAVGDKAKLTRYATSYVPMDEALSRCVIDISGRAYLVYSAEYKYQYMGTLETAMVKEFFYAFAMNSGVTLHLENLYGDNDHHKAESLFKAFARALGEASVIRDGGILSTKGTLD